MTNIKVSVIIPVYNTSAYLQAAVSSIQNQTLKDFEIIAVNDGSADDSLEILQKLASEDSRLKVISYEKNQGVSVCRNTGLEHAVGQYIYFFDSDDILEPDCLELCYQKMNTDNSDFLIFDGISFYENGIKPSFNASYQRTSLLENKQYTGADLAEFLHQKKAYTCSICLCFIRKSYLDGIALSFYPGVLYEDVLYTIILYLSAQNVSFIRRSFFRRRIRANSTMTSTISQRLIDYRYTVGNELLKEKMNFDDRKMRKLLNLQVRNLFIFLIKSLLRSKQYGLLLRNAFRIKIMLLRSLG